MGAAGDAQVLKHAAHLVEVAPELHHHGGLGVAQAVLQFIFRQHPGEHREALVAVHQGHAEHRRAAQHGADARYHFHLVAARQAVVQVHVGAVEEGVAFADHRHVAAGFQVLGHLLGGGVVEVADDGLVGQRWFQFLGGHRIDQRHALLGFRQVLLDDAEGVAALALAGLRLGHEIAHHGRRLQQAQGLDRDQLRVAGADAQADQPSLATHHSTSVARALTAAAAMALPPRRPRTIT
ncbi:hypothetical protein D9M68_760660 [compost metagenome]